MNYRLMNLSKIKELNIGDSVYIGIKDSNNKTMFIESVVTRPLFWNSDADEPDWEVETNNGFVDVYSIYQPYNSLNDFFDDFLKDLIREEREQM